MAHPTTIQQHALAASDVIELEKKLERAVAERGRRYADVMVHVAEHGPVTCSFNNTDELLTIDRKNGELVYTLSVPNFRESNR